MADTLNLTTPNVGLFRCQITADLQAANPTIFEVGEVGSWVDVSRDVQLFEGGKPAPRQVTEVGNISQTARQSSRQRQRGLYSPKVTAYDKNGLTEDWSTTNPFNLIDDVFKVADDNDLELPIQVSIGGEVGDQLWSYTNCYVLDGQETVRIQEGTTDPLTTVITFTASSRTPSTVA